MKFRLTLMLALLSLATVGLAEEHAPEGLLPIPHYADDMWTRSTLTGDWGGARTDLAEHGVQLGLEWTQGVQAVVDGGRDRETEYIGTLDYLVSLDLHRMGLLPGALVKIRAESRYGNSVNGIAGPLLPVYLDAVVPFTDEPDEDVLVYITNLTYYQFLSEKLGFYVGKMDTFDGDLTEFASGRGVKQFSNFNLIFNPVVSMLVPYSTLGAGVFCHPNEALTLTASVINTVDSSSTSGFDDIGEGSTGLLAATWQYTLGGLPGGQNLSFAYAWDNDFTDLNQFFVLEPGEALAPNTVDDSWAVFWSGWQYLYTEEPAKGPLNLMNGTPDLEGVGLFLRAGTADEDTNPVDWAISGGLGGRGILPRRDNDTFGVGAFHTVLRDDIFGPHLKIDDHTQGFECFYNIAVTPAAQLTLDAQVVTSAFSKIDDGVVLGARLHLSF